MLKTHELVKYLPYDVLVQYENKDYRLFKLQEDGFCMLKSENDLIEMHIDYCKPYLRTISQMADEITHNGKTFVPIVELAKLAGHNTYYEPEYIDNDRIFVFLDKVIDFSFAYFCGTFACVKGFEIVSLANQIKLFEWCYEHHFWLGDQSYFDKGLILKLEN